VEPEELEVPAPLLDCPEAPELPDDPDVPELPDDPELD
jgi:hypothetical protein